MEIHPHKTTLPVHTMSSLTATTRFYNAELILLMENEFRQALKEHNKEYASYLETRLGELYGYFMNRYAGTPDLQISRNKKTNT